MNGITAAILFLALVRVLEHCNPQSKSTAYMWSVVILALLSVFTLFYALVSLFF